MNIIARKRLLEFAEKHPDCFTALESWYRIVKRTDYNLMEEHCLKQSDLSEIGSQGVISEILSGKRQLNVRQIKILSKLFKVSPAVFI